MLDAIELSAGEKAPVREILDQHSHKTSTKISEAERLADEQRLRNAAIAAKHRKFFESDERLEIVVDPTAKSVEEWAVEASAAVAPEGVPTLCWLAYQAALGLCGGNDTCQAIAYAAYQACLAS